MRVIEYVNLPDDEQSQLTMLLCKATSTSSKNRRAMELGVEIITEDEFVERFG